jgi:hypothetical protein
MNHKRDDDGGRSDFKSGTRGSFHLFMEAVDGQNDWIAFYRNIDGNSLRRLRRRSGRRERSSDAR